MEDTAATEHNHVTSTSREKSFGARSITNRWKTRSSHAVWLPPFGPR